MNHETFDRRWPVGAECGSRGGVDFRVWAPKRGRVRVVFESGVLRGAQLDMAREPSGYHRLFVPKARPGMLYRFRLDEEPELYPDPASRGQPEGPHGPSLVVDPSSFAWTDADFPGARACRNVVYELHLGTFTPEGTWAAATAELPELARLGVTMLEIMPIAEFSGSWGWGYDGVNLFAPSHLYGSPDDARAFVDRAHSLGLSVVVDVVYNHFGPDGNYLPKFSDHYFSKKHRTEWGEALNFDDRDNGPVRELVVTNAVYWICEFHFDGLRLDATQTIFDASDEHILAEISRATREAMGRRTRHLVAENETQNARLFRDLVEGGYGVDAVWNDDFHHAARVALTGRREAYYTDYGGTPQELVSALKYGFLFQGQHYLWQKKARGTPALDVDPTRFVAFLENHDQVANSATGARLFQLCSPGRYRALTALLLLGPSTPLLFQGQEFASSKPFLYFVDPPPDLAPAIREGRREFLVQFASIRSSPLSEELADPTLAATFERCKLDLSERRTHAAAYAMHRALLALRKSDAVFGVRGVKVDGAVLAEHAFAVRFFGRGGDDRLLLVNLGDDLRLARLSEPLLAHPSARPWEVLLSTEDPSFGGSGARPLVEPDGAWRLTPESTLVLAAGLGGAAE